MATYYQVLGVPEGASDDEIRQAYRRLAKAAHPDGAGSGDPARFRLITDAYDVLSDPVRRAAYDCKRRPAAAVAAPDLPPRRPRYGRYALLAVAALVVGTVVWLVPSAAPSLGDDCLVGTWRGEAFEVPFRAFLDGREVAVGIRGGAGITLTVETDGTVRSDYAGAAPLIGTAAGYRVEGAYAGTTVERWFAADGKVRQSGTDSSGLEFWATVNGRPPDQPLSVTLVDRELPYSCTATTLDLGPYRYTRA